MTKKLQNNRTLNAVKHGATAGILPDEQRAWRRHLQAIRDELQPAGPVEEALTERAAFALWRLHRVAGWEASILTDAAERATEPPRLLVRRLVPGSPPDRQQAAALGLLRSVLRDWLGPFGDAAEVVAEARDAADLQRGTALAAERLLSALDAGDPGVLADLGDGAVAAGYALVAALDASGTAALADRWGVALEEVADVEPGPTDLPVLVELVGAERARVVLEETLREARGERARLEAALAAYAVATAERQARARPDFAELEKLRRHEAHLERVLYRALHELEALQARRQGAAPPLARLAVYGTDVPPAFDE